MKQSSNKANGRIYTPDYIVGNILDLCGYYGVGIFKKHIIDNSCGDGAFLCEVVRRYCEAGKLAKLSQSRITRDLREFVHGIEIDPHECEKCRENVSLAAAEYGIIGVDWDINCADSLTVSRYDGKTDYVVGNPPYVRVHNLSDYNAVKRFSFAQSGMTDLYIVFCEIGLRMLNPTGVLGYISPSSMFSSVAASYMRTHLLHNRSIKTVVDLKHFQPFNATAYTAIMLFTSEQNDLINYYEYDKINQAPSVVSQLSYEDILINNSFVFGRKSDLDKLREITSHKKANPVCTVKNGFATLYDDFFIGEVGFEEYTIPIIKASTGQMTECFFPYDENGRLIPFDVLTLNPKVKKHYERHITRLKNRSLEKSDLWYGFGRSQGINDVGKRKFAINTLIRNVGDVKLQLCESGTGVYSGLYILTELEYDELHGMLCADDFISYIALLGKYKSGGYYTFSSKDLAMYINHKFAEMSGLV
jgi:adenine-specific DNA-methyltransferase